MAHGSGSRSRSGAEPILEGVDLEVPAGQFVSLVGPSGSGKTSILRVVTGLLEPERGDVQLDVGLPQIGFLFQDDALLPWRTALQNVALGLRIRGQPQATAEAHQIAGSSDSASELLAIGTRVAFRAVNASGSRWRRCSRWSPSSC